MTQKTPTTTWIWPTDHGGMHGASIEVETGRVVWYDDAAGCACSSSRAQQSIEQFLQRGPTFGTVPDSVVAEMRAALQELLAN
jgi:hypothetical protein